MEETLQKEKGESELKTSDGNQGGVQRRLRDRELLRKRKAEAEEKETIQVESRRKRPRGEQKSSAGKRGRPRKMATVPDIPIAPEDPALAPGAPAEVVASEPAEVIPAQALPTLIPFLSVGSEPLKSQPAYVPTAATPIAALASIETPVLTPTLASSFALASAPSQAFAVAPSPVSVPTPSASATPPEDEPAPVPDPAPSEALSQGPVLASVGTLSVPSPSSLYTESQGSADLVLIEDIGSDEDEDISLFQEKRAAAELSEEPTVSVLEQNNIFSNPTLNSPPPPSEYLPGN
ncbi:uncharacterized protein hemgn isoform X2 [Lampris incognitus]|uniref:uncharacterized protein hemgn isoform X2 n=1 Tax=Lampris incognitus TaxID=2546036 RepID=UPI0024B58BE6|nr:uncharacterized protein hemgn isoform X2 [Lampris incognitus]